MYDGPSRSLFDTIVYFNVPVYGRVPLRKIVQIPLNGEPIKINVANKIAGSVKFTKPDKEVLMQWTIDTPFSGEMDDQVSVFPT